MIVKDLSLGIIFTYHGPLTVEDQCPRHLLVNLCHMKIDYKQYKIPKKKQIFVIKNPIHFMSLERFFIDYQSTVVLEADILIKHCSRSVRYVRLNQPGGISHAQRKISSPASDF